MGWIRVTLTVVLALALAIATTGCEFACESFGGGWVPISFYFDLGSACDHDLTPSAATQGDVLFFGTSAHLAGALGTNWRSDVEIHSVGNETAFFTVVLLEHGVDNSKPRSVQLTLEPGHCLRLDDVLDRQFDLDGKAALVLAVTAGRIVATSRTYNLLLAGNLLGLPGGATFGQYVSALARSDAIRHGEQGRLIQLAQSNATTSGQRTNLGLVNATSLATRVEIELHAADGTRLGGLPVNLPAYGYRQLDRVFNSVTGGALADGYAIVRTPTEKGAFFAYASVIDNATGDPITVTAARLPEIEPAGTGEPVWVVGAANLVGFGGTNWRTDVEIHAWGTTVASYTIELLKHGQGNSTPVSRSYTLKSGASVRFGDILATEFGFDGKAALRITPTAGHLLVTSRTYNLLGSGNPLGLPAGATFGQFIPGLKAEAAIRIGKEGRLIQLAHDPDSSKGFRTNLGLVNASIATVNVEVDLYRSDGSKLGTVTRALAPLEYRQLNLVFAEVTNATVDDGYAVVRTTTNGGEIFALASVVDNLTGDPVGMSAAIVLSSEAEGVLGEIDGVLDVMGGTTIDATVDFIRSIGTGGIIGNIVAASSGVARRTATGMIIDYGRGTTTRNGKTSSGTITVDVSGLIVSSNAITGTVTFSNDNVLVDGKPPTIGSSAWTLDLEKRADGTVAGDITAKPLGGAAASGSVSGTITIDTAICRQYPISGSLTVVYEGGIVTLSPSPACDRNVARDVGVIPPGVDFFYSVGNPENPRASAFLASVSNATVGQEGEGRYWRPMVGSDTFAKTTPGVLTYHFGFDRPIVSGRLFLTLGTFHFPYSRGHAFLYGSTDGASWQKLAEVTPPELNQGKGGGWNGPLPGLFVSAKNIWLQVKLYSYGPSASKGGIYVNTAQLMRWGPGQTTNTFELAVDLKD